MTKTQYILFGITLYIISMIIIIIILNLVNKKANKKITSEIQELERNKNLIISASIISELNKVEALINNSSMRETYNEWQKRFKKIKETDIPKITDELIEIEELFAEKKIKDAQEHIDKLEININFIKNKSNKLLEEIKEITESEEKNREIITKLKLKYRSLVKKFNQNKNDFKEITAPLELQFENIDKLFHAFEKTMEINNYEEVGKIVRAIDDTVGNLEIIIEEAPSIILMANVIIPKKITNVLNKRDKLVKTGFNLDYLNLDYNIEEINKKISDILSRLSILNVEDSILELKTIVEYFETTYEDFDKEEQCRKTYEEYSRTILIKIRKSQKIVNQLVKKIDSFKFSYDLKDDDIKIIPEIEQELNEHDKTYEEIIAAQRSKTFAYSKIGQDIELLNDKLIQTEDKLSFTIKKLGSLKEDELRAVDQLEEINKILKKSKQKINSYKLPVLPKKYHIELAEANMAIKEIEYELSKKPISIKILNTRVDTARDLVLKLYKTSNEMVKTAAMAELAIVYGNRYRTENKLVDIGIDKAEKLFTTGGYKQSLEKSIMALNQVEPGIHKRLLEYSQK